MSRPRISVVIPAYNAAQWIGETLESVLGQSAEPDEVIVVDDGSTDDTHKIATGYVPRIRIVSQENRGAAGAWNRGFREARSDFVAKCPADDLWEPLKLEWQREAIVENPTADLLFGGAQDFGVVEGDLPAPPGSGLLDNSKLLPVLYEDNCFAAPTAVMRRSLHTRLNGFREDLSGSEDYDFWLRALEDDAVFFYDPRLLTRLRKHGDNLSLQALRIWRLNHQIHQRHAKAIDDDQLVRGTLARDLLRIGRCSLGVGDVDGARAAYRAALAHRVSLTAMVASAALTVPGAKATVHRFRPPSEKHRCSEGASSGGPGGPSSSGSASTNSR